MKKFSRLAPALLALALLFSTACSPEVSKPTQISAVDETFSDLLTVSHASLALPNQQAPSSSNF